MAHREDIRSFFKDVDLKGLDVVDWGCGTKPIKNYIGGAKSYYGIDMLDHVGADLVADIGEYVVLKQQYDAAFCLEVMEHVLNTKILLLNIARSLKKGGKLYLSVPFLYPVHSDKDYWRFTDQGLLYLLKPYFHVDEIKATEGNAGWVLKATRI